MTACTTIMIYKNKGDACVLDLIKSYDFFKPESCRERLHIIGCGSVGSTLAELLVRFGLINITLYDFDIVEPHNLANQIFWQEHVGSLKVEATNSILSGINPDITNGLKLEAKGYSDQRLSGYVFLCVDTIELRRKIALSNRHNSHIKAMFDFRTRLTDAQHYAADWANITSINNFLKSMEFTHEEAMAETPVSACNIALSVAPTIRMICALGVMNFINFSIAGELKKFVQADVSNFLLDAF